MKNIKVIAFDADDTLWVNEPYFRATEEAFSKLLKAYLPEEEVNTILFSIQMRNLELYGYGIKGFVLSMVETILKITEGKGDLELVSKAISFGKEMLNKPVELLEGVGEVLKSLNGDYRVVLATKGDLLDQERKLIKSGLEKHFHHIEIMSDKKPSDYQKLLKHLDCKPENFLMVGNSVKSDILPVLEIGSYAVHVPFHTTWAHEEVKKDERQTFPVVENISEVANLLK
ncbi:putative hydrolase of the HAD superfamily [Lutibacter agarilyticus]|uniref:Putative hydrolase of the HAD superfamily n=1 Tax=Lutibacter agarilyticus TaxID=1109740 RepID=A0A238WKC7_9FLAO|nr:HAD family hydrolase [Lutibacter agarilyticus]SNR47015.1 putative hydrolase of the HAD superfamily [Lutibacter agarilyticus]